MKRVVLVAFLCIVLFFTGKSANENRLPSPALSGNCNTDGITRLTTDCEPITTLPWGENFDTYGNKAFPECWYRPHYYIDGADTFPSTHTTSHNASEYGLRTRSTFVVTPEFSTPLNAIQLSFWAKREGPNSGVIKVGVMTNPNDTSTFTLLHTVAPTTNDWTLFELDFLSYTGSGAHIAFKQEAVYQNWYYFLDDITVSTYNPCRRPTGLNIVSVSSTEVTFSWSSAGVATQWNANCDTVGFTPGDGRFFDNATDTIWTIYGLTPNTQYELYIQSNCGTAQSEWSFPITFSTSQEARVIPYTFDFEDDDENVNWALSNSPGDNKWYIGDVVHQGNDGTNALYISKNGTAHQYNTSSQGQSWAYRDIYFDPAFEYNLSFYWMAKGEEDYGVWDYMKVYIGDPTMVSGSTSSSLTAPAGATLLRNGSSDYFVNASTWQHFSLDLDSTTYAGKTKRLYFVWVNDGGSGTNPPAAIDNLKITAVYCLPPTNLAVSFTTDDEPQFSWTPALSADQEWEIVCVPANADPNTGTPIPTNAHQNVIVSGLASGAAFDAYVRTVCSFDDASEWSAKLSFSTTCNPITQLPWRENFDSEMFPVCMSRPVMYGTFPSVTSATMSGTPSALRSNMKTVAVTPQFAAEVRDLQISFSLCGEGSSSGDFIVGVMTDPTDTNTFVPVYTVTGASRDWTTHEFSFSQQGYTDNGHYIAFKHLGIQQNYYYFLDNIEVDIYSPCPRPSDLTVHSAGSDEALVSWSVNGGALGWDVVWGETGFDPATAETTNATDTFLNISGLNPMTSYQFYVRSTCDTINSIWSMAGSFITTQTPGTLPYFCDFDDDDENANWAFANADANDWMIGNATNADENGEKSLYISNDGENHAYTETNSSFSWAFRDIYFAPAREYHISFDWMARGESSGWSESTPNDYMKVLIGSPVNVTGSTNAYQAIPDGLTELPGNNTTHFLNQATWAHYTTIIDESYGGSVQRIYFLWRNNASNGNNPPAAIDNFDIMPVSCFAPQQLAISDITSDGATISWSPLEDETEWRVVCVPFGEDPDSGDEINPYDTTYTFGGLQAGRFYDIYVKSVCSAYEQSAWSSKATFSTLCDIISILPWEENFNALEIGQFPACMSRPFIHTVSDNQYPSVVSTNNTKALRFRSDTITFAVTPEFAENVADLQISFQLRKESASAWPGKFIVGVMTDAADTSTFVPIHTLDPDHDRWNLYELDFQSYQDDAKFIAFKHQSVGSNHYYFLDDVEVDAYNPCRRPTNLQVESVSINSATVSWHENGEATSWIIEYGRAGFEISEGTTITVTDTIWTITPLDAETQYDFYITPLCGSSAGEISFPASFTTLQEALTVPFVVNFEDDNENGNWGFANNGINNWVIDTAANNTENGSKALYITYDTVTHRYNTSATGYSWAYRDVTFSNAYGFTLSFDWKAGGEYTYDEGYCDYMRVFIGDIASVSGGTSSTPQIPSGAVALPNDDESYFLEQNTWTRYSTDLAMSYAGTTKRIYFLWRNDFSQGANPPAAIDNFSISELTCIAPVVINVDNITTTTADVGWGAISPEDTAWQIVWVETGENILLGTPVQVNTPHYTITGLTAGTIYDVYVMTVCSDDDRSSWSEVTTFSTGCNIITTLPWTENFDRHATGTFPPCMHRPVMYMDNPTTVSSNVVSAPNALFFRSNFVSIATTPEFAEDIKNVKITFSIRGEGSLSGVMIVGVMSDPADSITFEPMHTVYPPNRAWDTVELGFSNYAGVGKYIAFKHVSQAQNYYIFIDDMEVSLNTCATPSNIVVSSVTNASATIDWTVGGDEDQWKIEWRPTASTGSYSEATVTSHPYTINGLQANTPYTVNVRAVCGTNMTSAAATTTFTTEQGTQMFTITATADNNSIISPSGSVQVAQGGSKTFTISAKEYYVIDDVLVNGVSVGTPASYTFTNVQGDSTIHVTSRSVGINDYDESAVSVYPNPANTTITIEFDGQFESLTITNILGQELSKTTINDTKIMLNVSNYESGIYFIQLRNSTGVITKKFVKQ